MKDSEIYLRAAELCAIRHETKDPKEIYRIGCCDFIELADFDASWRLIGQFTALFKPRNPDRPLYWFGPFCKETHKARVLALLFMHEIAKDEGR